MANVGTATEQQKSMVVVGIVGVNDNDIVIEINEAERFNEFTLMSTAGSMDVEVSLDGTNFSLPGIAFTDLRVTAPATKITATAPDVPVIFKGTFKAIRISQKDATAVADAVLICSKRV